MITSNAGPAHRPVRSVRKASSRSSNSTFDPRQATSVDPPSRGRQRAGSMSTAPQGAAMPGRTVRLDGELEEARDRRKRPRLEDSSRLNPADDATPDAPAIEAGVRPSGRGVASDEWQPLRQALQDAGVHLPDGASLWRLPETGEPVACDPELPLIHQSLPSQFKWKTGVFDAADLLADALGALAGSAQGDHSIRDRRKMRHEVEVTLKGQPVMAVYEAEDRQVTRLKLEWDGKPLAVWESAAPSRLNPVADLTRAQLTPTQRERLCTAAASDRTADEYVTWLQPAFDPCAMPWEDHVREMKKFCDAHPEAREGSLTRLTSAAYPQMPIVDRHQGGTQGLTYSLRVESRLLTRGSGSAYLLGSSEARKNFWAASKDLPVNDIRGWRAIRRSVGLSMASQQAWAQALTGAGIDASRERIWTLFTVVEESLQARGFDLCESCVLKASGERSPEEQARVDDLIQAYDEEVAAVVRSPSGVPYRGSKFKRKLGLARELLFPGSTLPPDYLADV
jgi:hypothetical protein